MVRKLNRSHAYQTPSGERLLADLWWASGAPDGVPPAGWVLLAAHSVFFVADDGALAPREATLPPLRLADLRDLGPHPWCVRCDFGYDPECWHAQP